MCADRIHACQMVVYKGLNHVPTAIPGDVSSYSAVATRLHCTTAGTEALARRKLDDIVRGWCRGNRWGVNFSCEETVQRGKIDIYKNPSLGFRFKLWLKELFL